MHLSDIFTPRRERGEQSSSAITGSVARVLTFCAYKNGRFKSTEPFALCLSLQVMLASILAIGIACLLLIIVIYRRIWSRNGNEHILCWKSCDLSVISHQNSPSVVIICIPPTAPGQLASLISDLRRRRKCALGEKEFDH